MKSTAEGIWVAEVELATTLWPRGVSRLQRRDDRSARILVRLHRQVVGFVSLSLAGEHVTADAVASAVRAQLAGRFRRHLEAENVPVPTVVPVSGIGGWRTCAFSVPPNAKHRISVVVCTAGQPRGLVVCLNSLRRLRYPCFEVIVVDNAPSGDEIRQWFVRVVGHDPRFSYVTEPKPGLSRARNCGMRRATANLVAFTDDDVQVDPWWLDGIAAGFARDPRAGCVTGLVPPARLDHAAQQYFDRRYAWGSHIDGRVYDLTEGRDASRLYPYSAGIFGTGANFAADRELLQRLGGFDESLGAGTPAGGGEDLDFFVRVLRAGRSIVYEPSAIAWHEHRDDLRALRRQVFSYGAGLTAFLTKYLADPHTAGEILTRLPEGARRLRRVWSSAEPSGKPPAALILSEALGMASGPFAYTRGRRRLRRAA